MMHEFSFAGVSCRDFGIWCSGKETAQTPVRDVTKIEIPGKSGDLIIDNGRYRNVRQAYDCFAYGNFMDRFRRFRNFVLLHPGYQRLEDSYAPDEYRIAAVPESFNPEIGGRLRNGSFTIQFDCKPQRYLKSGETEYHFSQNGYLINPEFTDAKPIIRVGGNGTIGVGSTTITISDSSSVITIDSEIMDAYSGTTNCNDKVTMTNGQFPVLGPGRSGVTIGTGITSLVIIPRWWRL